MFTHVVDDSLIISLNSPDFASAKYMCNLSWARLSFSPFLKLVTFLGRDFASILKKELNEKTGKLLNLKDFLKLGKRSPRGNRTPVSGVRGQRPNR